MSKTYKLALAAVLTGIGVALNVCSISTGTFLGRVSFVYSFCYLAGVYLGPLGGCLVAMLADVLQCLFFPQPGPYVVFLTISNGLIAAFCGIGFKYFKKLGPELGMLIGAVLGYFICSAGISAFGESLMLFNIYPYTFAKLIGAGLGFDVANATLGQKFVMMSISKLATQWAWIIMNYIITLVIYESTKVIVLKKKKVKSKA